MRCSSNLSPARRVKQRDIVLVFDLDDTLYLERDYVESGLRAVGQWARDQLGVDSLGAEMLQLFQNGTRERIFDRALTSARIMPTPVLIQRMLQVYRQHEPLISLADDVTKFFAETVQNVGFAVITDGFRDAQKRKIRALGLHALGVELAICTDRWGRADWKPSPRAFEYVQAFFGYPPTSYVYVADNANKDFHAPKRLGWSTVQILRPNRLHTTVLPHAESAHEVITTFDSLLHQNETGCRAQAARAPIRKDSAGMSF